MNIYRHCDKISRSIQKFRQPLKASRGSIRLAHKLTRASSIGLHSNVPSFVSASNLEQFFYFFVADGKMFHFSIRVSQNFTNH